MKRKWLGHFLQTARATPRRGRDLGWGTNPDRRHNVVSRLLRNPGESDASRDTATLSQRRPRQLIGLIGSRHLPQSGKRWGERKRRGAGKNRRGLGEGKNAGIKGKTGGDGSGLHRARSGKRLVLRGGHSAGRGRRTFEGDAVVEGIIVVPPFTGTGCSEPSNEDDGVLGKLLLVKLERDDKAETIPLELLRTILTIGKSSDRITYSPRPREGRREVREGADVLAHNL
jgi:hypothetical protein